MSDNDETYCHLCLGPNVVWSAPSPLWNEVMRGGDINGDEPHDGIVCPVCFATLAEQAGIAEMWRFTPERIHKTLTYQTPSGRIWDDEEFLWV